MNARAWRAIVTGVVLAALTAGCARPNRGPKTLAAVGTALLVTGGTAWVVGERRDNRYLLIPGFVGTAVGIAAVLAAGGWLATTIACEADADCPLGEECREVPAPPGGVPYRQCTGR